LRGRIECRLVTGIGDHQLFHHDFEPFMPPYMPSPDVGTFGLNSSFFNNFITGHFIENISLQRSNSTIND
jgi:hypothetical protein